MLRRTMRFRTSQKPGFTKLGSVTLAALFAVACGESPGPVSPDAPPGPSLAAATRTPFTTMWTNASVIDLPPGPRFPGKSFHFWNDVNSGPVTGDLVGTLTVVTDFDGSFAAGKGSLKGIFTLDLAGGTFEGRSAGIFDFTIGLSTGHIQGHGTGAYAGQKIRGTYTNGACLCFDFDFEGVITNPNP